MLDVIILCFFSALVAMLVKANNNRGGNPVVFLIGNYLAGAAAAVIIVFVSDFTYSIESLLFGIMMAVLYITGFYCFIKVVEMLGVAVAAVISRITLLIPVLLSIIIFNELPGGYQITGLGFVAAAFYFLFKSMDKNKGQTITMKGITVLLLMFFTIGFADFGMKIFTEWRGEDEKKFFIAVIYTFALLFAVGLIIIKSDKFNSRTFSFGLGAGLFMLVTTFALVRALEVLPGIIVFPMANAGTILLTILAGALVFGERWNRQSILTIIFGTIAVIFLSIPSG